MKLKGRFLPFGSLERKPSEPYICAPGYIQKRIFFLSVSTFQNFFVLGTIYIVTYTYNHHINAIAEGKKARKVCDYIGSRKSYKTERREDRYVNKRKVLKKMKQNRIKREKETGRLLRNPRPLSS